MQANQPHYHSVIEETVTFNMGTMDSRENGMNNKNNRKLKKKEEYGSQNTGGGDVRLEDSEILERRAKSSLGDHSVNRGSGKSKQGSKNDATSSKLMMIN